MAIVHPYILEAVKLAAELQTRRHMGQVKLLPRTLCALKFLIDAAIQGNDKVCYDDVSSRCGLGNAQWANITFHPIAIATDKVKADSKFPYRDIPDLSAIVSKKGTSTVGMGFFSAHPEGKDKNNAEKAKLLSDERARVSLGSTGQSFLRF